MFTGSGTGSGTGSDAASESEGEVSDDEGSTTEDEDALEGLQKRFGVTPTTTKRELVTVGMVMCVPIVHREDFSVTVF